MREKRTEIDTQTTGKHGWGLNSSVIPAWRKMRAVEKYFFYRLSVLIFSLGVLPCKTPGIYYSRHPCRQGVYLMLVNGCNCSIAIKTDHWEIDVPYSDETVREAVTLL